LSYSLSGDGGSGEACRCDTPRRRSSLVLFLHERQGAARHSRPNFRATSTGVGSAAFRRPGAWPVVSAPVRRQEPSGSRSVETAEAARTFSASSPLRVQTQPALISGLTEVGFVLCWAGIDFSIVFGLRLPHFPRFFLSKKKKREEQQRDTFYCRCFLKRFPNTF